MYAFHFSINVSLGIYFSIISFVCISFLNKSLSCMGNWKRNKIFMFGFCMCYFWTNIFIPTNIFIQSTIVVIILILLKSDCPKRQSIEFVIVCFFYLGSKEDIQQYRILRLFFVYPRYWKLETWSCQELLGSFVSTMVSYHLEGAFLIFTFLCFHIFFLDFQWKFQLWNKGKWTWYFCYYMGDIY